MTNFNNVNTYMEYWRQSFLYHDIYCIVINNSIMKVIFLLSLEGSETYKISNLTIF